MQTHPLIRTAPRLKATGNSLAPVLLVLAALGISAAVFFLFTKKRLQAEKSTPPAQTAPAESAAKNSPKAENGPTAPSTTSPAPSSPKAATEAVFGFARPTDLGKQMAQSLASNDFAAVGKLAAASDPAQAAEAAQLFQQLQNMGFKPGTADQVELLGQVENHTRIAIPLTKTGSTEPLRLQLDLERDERMGWKIAKITLPKEAAAALTTTTSTAPTPAPQTPAPTVATDTSVTTPAPPVPPMPTTPGSATSPPPIPPPPSAAPSGTNGTAAAPKKSLFVIEETPDALTFSTDFVKHLLNHDFTAARDYIDPQKVHVERLAGLCIVFEEGNYRLKPSKPLLVTVANPEVSWVIAQVDSESLQQSTEFGLELKRESPTTPWKVAGINLSQILGSFAQNASRLGIPYAPIVTNPRGGESLALYFEYDQAVLHPRALKQIQIIAAIMKADPSKKLRIAGHTDALGGDDYNVNLSRTRADTVKSQLAALGVPAAQIETVGLGKAQPLSPNLKADGTDDPEGRSHNRRAEIYLDF